MAFLQSPFHKVAFLWIKTEYYNSITYGEDMNPYGQTLFLKASFRLSFASFLSILLTL